jgi:hypothetical protein
MKIRYLFDENLGLKFTTVLKRHLPMIDTLRGKIVGDNV